MKALLSTAPGGPELLELAEIPPPALEPGRVLVEVKACGINFPDVLIIRDKYQTKPPRPFAPGAEIAGVVAAVGEGVEGFQPGDHVAALLVWGGLAEQVAVDPRQLVKVPKTMAFDEASAFLLTYGTSYLALKQRARLQAGERLLVLGAAGGVGAAAVQLGAAMGARVIAAVSTPEKAAFCRGLGASEVVIYPPGAQDRDAQRALSAQFKAAAGGELDVVYDAVGGDYAEAALRALGWAGRYLVVGFAAGEIPRLPLNLALLKNADILGVWWGAWTERNPDAHRRNTEELLALWAQGRIRPQISARFPLSQGADALRRLESRTAMGKVVVTVADDGAG